MTGDDLLTERRVDRLEPLFMYWRHASVGSDWDVD